MSSSVPLATKMKPKTLEEFIGQDELVGKGGPLRQIIELGEIPSMIFWGPPASGKTSLAEIIAGEVNADFLRLSAVIDGKAKLKDVISIAEQNFQYNKVTILFIDEIHRWNKAQQDALLPFVEKGSITLIGATTENPSFTVVAPLLSRSRVFVFQPHSEKSLEVAIKRGLKLLKTTASPKVIAKLAELANGDMRFALNTLELSNKLAQSREKNINSDKKIRKSIKEKSDKNTKKSSKSEPKVSGKSYKITVQDIEKASQKFLRYDKKGEEHYNIISAVHKSLRSSNASAASYWIMRMLEAGDDPLYIARRLLRFASEDIGNANPNALLLANQVYESCHKLGMPECDTALIQLAQYLANSPKDNSAYAACNQIRQDIEKYGNLPVPMHFRNAPTKLMKDIGYGKGYEYDHDLSNKKSDQQCLPDKLKNKEYFPAQKPSK